MPASRSPSSPLLLAVFDVDGTLIDSQHNILAAMASACLRLSIAPPAPHEVRRIIGLSLVEACAALLPHHQPDTHEALAVAYKEAFLDLRTAPGAEEPLFPGALEALARLEEAGWLLGLATGKSRRGVARMLDEHGLEGRFVTIQTADDNPGKPHPAMLLEAAAACGVETRRMAMIGDTSFDMRMAAAAGALGIGVAWGYHPAAELALAGACRVIQDFDSLDEALGALTGDAPCA